MKSIILVPSLFLVLVAAFLVNPARSTAVAEAPLAPPAGYDELKQQAEKLLAEHSYAQARDLYRQAEAMQLSPGEKRWVDFRIADATWRAQAGTQTSDSSIFDKAREQLESLINSIKRAEDQDVVWAESQESLGDFWWMRRESQNWGQGWNNYQNALNWWAGSSQLDLARSRYLAIVWRMAEPSWMDHGFYRYGINIPIEVLDNAAKIAVTPNDKAHAHYLIAMELRGNGDWRQQRRVAQEFEGAIVAGKSVDWYDDALFAYGDWLMNTGRTILLENGQWQREPDFPAALGIFQRLVREFKKDQTRYWDDAQNRIKEITSPVVNVSVSNNFLPGSEIQYYLGWRNVKQIDLTLYRVNLTRDLRFSNVDDPVGNWMKQIELGAAEKIRSWTKDTKDKEDYRPGQSTERMDEPLPLGAYVLDASGGGVSAREVIFVTDAAVMMKAVNDQVLLYACDANSGAPLAKASIRLWKFIHDDHKWVSADATRQADDNGLSVFDKSDFRGIDASRTPRYFAAVMLNDRQSIAMSNAGWFAGQTRTWRIYAFTDRPAYRPNETVGSPGTELEFAL